MYGIWMNIYIDLWWVHYGGCGMINPLPVKSKDDNCIGNGDIFDIFAWSD